MDHATITVEGTRTWYRVTLVDSVPVACTCRRYRFTADCRHLRSELNRRLALYREETGK